MSRSTERREPWYRIEAKADSPAEVFIYDEIDSWFGVSADTFARELASLDVDAITVRINSPGGNVFDGIAIMNSLRGHKARVTAVVDGLAASAASFIAMAGDDIVMGRNSEMMIHDAHGIVRGNAADVADFAAQLERVSNNIASIYADRAGGTTEEWRAVMQGEQWYSAQEAVDAGLADRVEAKDSDSTKNRFDLSIFNYAGRAAAPSPRPETPSATEAEVTEKEEGAMPTLNEGLAQRLGVSADADDATILAAVDEALSEREDPSTDSILAAAREHNLVVLDRTRFDQLEANAAAGREAHARQIADANARVVDEAIAAGKFGPAQRAQYVALMTSAPEPTKALIDTMPAGAVPLAEIGHGVNPVDDSEAVYASLFGKEA